MFADEDDFPSVEECTADGHCRCYKKLYDCCDCGTRHWTKPIRNLFNNIAEVGEFQLSWPGKRIKELEEQVALLRDGKCLGVVPGTYIVCGEDGNYCCRRCMFVGSVLKKKLTNKQ